MAFSLFYVLTKGGNKDTKLLWALNRSDSVQRRESVGGQTFALLYSLHLAPCHPNPLCCKCPVSRCVHQSCMVWVSNCFHRTSITLLLSLYSSVGHSLQRDTTWPRLVLVTEHDPCESYRNFLSPSSAISLAGVPPISACPLCPHTGLHDLSACLLMQQISDYLLLITRLTLDDPGACARGKVCISEI